MPEKPDFMSNPHKYFNQRSKSAEKFTKLPHLAESELQSHVDIMRHDVLSPKISYLQTSACFCDSPFEENTVSAIFVYIILCVQCIPYMYMCIVLSFFISTVHCHNVEMYASFALQLWNQYFFIHSFSEFIYLPVSICFWFRFCMSITARMLRVCCTRCYVL